MNKAEDFFSSNHKRLLGIATWAKYLAWVVLTIYVLSAGAQVIQIILLKDGGSFSGQTSQSFLTMLRDNPFNAFKLVVSVAVALLKGIMYNLILKGVSLGLNMIVETDINYREQRRLSNE